VTVEATSVAEAEKVVRQMADKLLANAILEDFTVEILGDESANDRPAGA
jgi:phosphoribosylformylglycinamidine (FGAM) synthase PurS component